MRSTSRGVTIAGWLLIIAGGLGCSVFPGHWLIVALPFGRVDQSEPSYLLQLEFLPTSALWAIAMLLLGIGLLKLTTWVYRWTFICLSIAAVIASVYTLRWIQLLGSDWVTLIVGIWALSLTSLGTCAFYLRRPSVRALFERAEND